MTAKKPDRKRLLAHCDELRDDDGIDPREFFKRTSGDSSRRQQRRKTGQLCQQVAHTLSLVLGSVSDDPRLRMRAQSDLTRIVRKLRPLLSYKGV